MKTAVVQFAQADALYIRLLAATFLLHSDNCQRHGYDYITSTMPRTDRHTYWEKCNLLRAVAHKGYEHIVWLDADTVWYGEALCLPPTVYGLTWHEPATEPAHYNAGVMYINNTGGQACEHLEQWWNEPDDGHKWADQYALGKLLARRPELVTRLEHRWNSVEYLEGHRQLGAIVSAWHGLSGQCLPEVTGAAMLGRAKQRALQP